MVGKGRALRAENRVPGGDVNPYLAQAAMLAGGLHGVRNELELEPAFVGNAYAADFARVPATLREARDRFAASEVAEAAFGKDVVVVSREALRAVLVEAQQLRYAPQLGDYREALEGLMEHAREVIHRWA